VEQLCNWEAALEFLNKDRLRAKLRLSNTSCAAFNVSDLGSDILALSSTSAFRLFIIAQFSKRSAISLFSYIRAELWFRSICCILIVTSWSWLEADIALLINDARSLNDNSGQWLIWWLLSWLITSWAACWQASKWL